MDHTIAFDGPAGEIYRTFAHKVDGLLLYLTAFGGVWALALAGEFDSAE